MPRFSEARGTGTIDCHELGLSRTRSPSNSRPADVFRVGDCRRRRGDEGGRARRLTERADVLTVGQRAQIVTIHRPMPVMRSSVDHIYRESNGWFCAIPRTPRPGGQGRPRAHVDARALDVSQRRSAGACVLGRRVGRPRPDSGAAERRSEAAHEAHGVECGCPGRFGDLVVGGMPRPVCESQVETPYSNVRSVMNGCSPSRRSTRPRMARAARPRKTRSRKRDAISMQVPVVVSRAGEP